MCSRRVTDFTRNGNSIISIDDGIVTNKLSRVMKPTVQQLQKNKMNLMIELLEKYYLFKQLHVSYDNENFTPTVGVIKKLKWIRNYRT